MSDFKQDKEWEKLFQKVINKAQTCPAASLFSNASISAEKVEDAAGNHAFDDWPEFWEITEQEGHQIRSVFQYYSCRRIPEFKQYIQELIDTAREVSFRKIN